MPATITSNIECYVCQQKHVVIVPDDVFNITMVGLAQWQSGEYLIQDALPFMSPDDREILISGISPSCQAVLDPDGMDWGDGEELQP